MRPFIIIHSSFFCFRGGLRPLLYWISILLIIGNVTVCFWAFLTTIALLDNVYVLLIYIWRATVAFDSMVIMYYVRLHFNIDIAMHSDVIFIPVESRDVLSGT